MDQHHRMLLVPVSAPIIVASDPGPASKFTGNVFLYDLTDPNSPAWSIRYL